MWWYYAFNSIIFCTLPSAAIHLSFFQIVSHLKTASTDHIEEKKENVHYTCFLKQELNQRECTFSQVYTQACQPEKSLLRFPGSMACWMSRLTCPPALSTVPSSTPFSFSCSLSSTRSATLLELWLSLQEEEVEGDETEEVEIRTDLHHHWKGISFCNQMIKKQLSSSNVAPGFTMVVDVISPHGGAERRVELLLLVKLQVEGFQWVHGPVEQRVIQQHLDSTLTQRHTLTWG